jgi:hypothetical protein
MFTEEQEFSLEIVVRVRSSQMSGNIEMLVIIRSLAKSIGCIMSRLLPCPSSDILSNIRFSKLDLFPKRLWFQARYRAPELSYPDCYTPLSQPFGTDCDMLSPNEQIEQCLGNCLRILVRESQLLYDWRLNGQSVRLGDKTLGTHDQ